MLQRAKTFLKDTRHKTAIFWTAIVGSALVSGALSLWIGMRQSVWFDEAYSILVAKQPISEIIRLTALDTHPPLSYMLLHGWAGVLGWDELSLRVMSVLALMATIIVAGLLLRKLFGTRVAIGAVLLLAVAPMLVRYGFEVRMYSVGVLIGVSATYALVMAQSGTRHPRRWLGLYAVLVAVGMYTMYSLALLWIAHVLWIVYRNRNKKPYLRAVMPYVWSYVGAIVLFLPWIVSFFSQLGNGALAPIGQPLNFENLMEIASFNLLYRALHEVGAFSTIVLLLLMGVAGYGLTRAFKRTDVNRDGLVLLGLSFATPVVIIMIVSLVSSVYVERYLLFAGVYGMMLLGVCTMLLLTSQRTLRAKVAVGLVYVGCFLGCMQLFVVGNYNYQRMQSPSIEQAVQSIRCESNERVVAADPYVAIELEYYLSDCPVYFISEYDELKGGYAPLSGSEKQIKSVEQLKGEIFTYVYYGEGDEQLVRLCTATERRIFEAMTVARLQCD